MQTIEARQIERERKSVSDGVIAYQRLVSDISSFGNASSLGAAKRMCRFWIDPMFLAIRAERAAVMRGSNGPGASIYGPAMMLIDCDRLALITITEMINCALKSVDGSTVGSTCYKIGSAILAEAEADLIIDNGNAKDAMDKRLRKLTSNSLHAYARKTMHDPLFNRRVAIVLGSRCLSIAMSVCMVDYVTEQKAFIRHSTKVGRKTINTIRLSKSALAQVDDAHEVRSLTRPRYSNMICSPRLWSDGNGGYLTMDVPICGRLTLDQSIPIAKNNLTFQRDALDSLSQQGWKINHTVMLVAMEMWKSGAYIPGVGNPDNTPLGERPQDEPSLKSWKRETALMMQKERQMSHNRAKFLRRLSASQNLAGDIFYMPHRMDWRGRMYPIATDLHHHFEDFSRGLLLFDHGGTVDEMWYKVHCANTWGHGVNRKPFEERLSWTEKNWRRMQSVAQDPINDDWWHEAANPWQFLACCVGAKRSDIARCIPIQMDHTANALQHLVALGLDTGGASMVNLSGSKDPYDPYDLVVKKIHRHICGMAEECHPMATAALPFVVRSILKRPLMTTVYRVSRHGAARQVYDALPSNTPNRMKLSRWISDVALDVMHETFEPSMNIVDWVESAARSCLATDKRALLAWQSPTGMTITQPYRNGNKNTIRTALQSITIYDANKDSPSNKRKQMSGVLANWVQSIEAAQMQSVCTIASSTGMPIAGVHDSYWTTSDNAKNLHGLAREHFVLIHNSDPLTKLAQDWSMRYPAAAIPCLPKRGNLDLDLATNSIYMLS